MPAKRRAGNYRDDLSQRFGLDYAAYSHYFASPADPGPSLPAR